LLDSDTTRQNIKNALSDLVNQTNSGDVIVFTYSGHGTSAYDLDEDEGDVYDEAIYVYDGALLDDEVREIIKGLNSEASLTVISDSCFSGTVTRIVSAGKPRYMPPQQQLTGKLRKKFLYPESDMIEILISGCSDSEYSYDAVINGRYNGAMSKNAIDVIRESPGATYSEFYEKLRKLLPSRQHPQTPQLEGTDSHKQIMLFEPFIVSGVEPPGQNPEPAPEPTPVDSGGIAWYWWVLLIIVAAVIVYFLILK